MTAEERLIKEKERLALMYENERALSGGKTYVFGIDEAGRGPLCGPVAAACVMLKSDCDILYLNDSKKLSEKRREELFYKIEDEALAYGIALVDEKTIDEINILNATLKAMKAAFDDCMFMYRRKNADNVLTDGSKLKDAFDNIPGMSDSVILIDGNKEVPMLELPQKTVVGGDARCPSISAASILAKVTRDRLLAQYDNEFPEYGFSKNKGYGTREHIAAIQKYGPCRIHRRSFLKNILQNE